MWTSFSSKNAKFDGKEFWVEGFVDHTENEAVLLRLAGRDEEGYALEDLYEDESGSVSIPVWDPYNYTSNYPLEYFKEVLGIVIDLYICYFDLV